MLPYQIIIGLETHVQLLTESKLFCGCATAFGSSPNTQVCPVCLGLPGALPALNRRAFELALKAACALYCEIPDVTSWDRKNYFYPDLPKGYQTSQYDHPIGVGGRLTISDPFDDERQRDIGLIRVHLEEDAGKSMHDEDSNDDFRSTRIDLNRTGVPLLEIVTKPDIHSPDEAYAFLTELKLLLKYLKVSECNMQEGNLRCDANVNLHVFPTEQNGLSEVYKTPIVEIKNLNSFRAVKAALSYEANRQYKQFLENAECNMQNAECENSTLHTPHSKETRLWDEQRQVTRAMRTKEDSGDYRYFHDPNLVPVLVSEDETAEVRQGLRRKPSELRRLLTGKYGLPQNDAEVLVNAGFETVEYFLQLADLSGDAKQSANWLTQEVMRVLNLRNIPLHNFPISAEILAELITAINSGRVPRSHAKNMFAEMLKSGGKIDAIIEKLGIIIITPEELEKLTDQIIAEHPRIVADILQGKAKAISSLIEKAKKLNRNIDPAAFETVLKTKIGAE